MTCHNCKYLDVRPDKDGKRRVRRNKTYRCLAPLPELKLPASVTSASGYREGFSKTMMAPDDGGACPTFRSPEASTELSHSTWGWP